MSQYVQRLFYVSQNAMKCVPLCPASFFILLKYVQRLFYVSVYHNMSSVFFFFFCHSMSSVFFAVTLKDAGHTGTNWDILGHTGTHKISCWNTKKAYWDTKQHTGTLKLHTGTHWKVYWDTKKHTGTLKSILGHTGTH